MFRRIGFLVEMVPVEGGGEEGRLICNSTPEEHASFVERVFRVFGNVATEEHDKVMDTPQTEKAGSGAGLQFPIGDYFYEFRPMADITSYEVSWIMQLFALSTHACGSLTDRGQYLREVWWDRVGVSERRHFVVMGPIEPIQRKRFWKGVAEISVIGAAVIGSSLAAVWIMSFFYL